MALGGRRELKLQARRSEEIDGLPVVSPSGEAVLYYDGAANELRASLNGAAFGPVLTVGGNTVTSGFRVTDTPAIYQYGNVAGKGPFVWMVQHNTYSATDNPGMTIGYNQTWHGVNIVSGEPGLSLNFEGDYNDGVKRDMEVYLQYLSADGLTTKRPIFFAITRDTGAFTSAVIRGNPITFKRDTDDIDVASFAAANVTVSAVTGQDSLLSINAATGRTASLRLGRDAVANAVTVASATNRCDVSVDATTILRLFSTPGGAAGAAIAVGANENAAIATFAVGSSLANRKGVVIRRRASQTGNLLELQDENSAALTYWDENGRVYQQVPNSAPTDADISNSQASVYVDQTGHTLNWRVRYSDGTYKSTSLALT